MLWLVNLEIPELSVSLIFHRSMFSLLGEINLSVKSSPEQAKFLGPNAFYSVSI